MNKNSKDKFSQIRFYKEGEIVPQTGIYDELGVNGLRIGQYNLRGGDVFPKNSHVSFSFTLAKPHSG